MKHELGKEFYDNVYLSAKKYNANYKSSPYFKMWTGILENIGTKNRIADFACGTGQFMHMAVANGHKVSYGVDFSEVAIARCKELVDIPLYCDTLYNDVYSKHEYDTAVMLEVLEHVKGDKGILVSIPKDKNVVVSVPNWDTESHVRHFNNVAEIQKRYGDVIDIDKINTFKVGNQGKKIFIIYGTAT